MSRLRIHELHIALRHHGGRGWGSDPHTLAGSLVRSLARGIASLTPVLEPTAAARPDTRASGSGERVRARAAARTHAGPSTRFAGARLETGAELRLGSALPFIALSSLVRLGWIDLLSFLLAEREVLAEAPTLASALAFKLLSIPRRGWLRPSADEQCAAAFAGGAEAVDEARRERVARLLAGGLGPLDDCVTRTLARGRQDREPAMLLRAPIDHALAPGGERGRDARGWLALELEGGFVLARAPELGELIADPALARAPLLVPASEAGPAQLRRLDAHGRAFLTDAPPGRLDDWRPLRRARMRLWSNAPGCFSRHARLVPLFEAEHRERLRRAWTGVVARPGILRPPDPELERSLCFAVHLSLAELAWSLWRSREPTDASLIYERFFDLELRLRIEREQVCLLLPRGRRREQLATADVLMDLENLPWWPGRRLVWGIA